MHRKIELPLLPGFNFNENIGRTNFHRNQYFDKIHDGVYYLAEKKLVHDDKSSRYPSICPGEDNGTPAWIAFDGQRLMFKAFFQETVQEMPRAAFQIRIVSISFFLEDGTIKISEPSVNNSGLEQGVLVKRQRIPIPFASKLRYYDILDLNIGKEPEIYGRVYKIVDCDKFTRIFLNRSGVAVPDPIEIPEDPYSKFRQSETFPRVPVPKIDTRGKFLKYDKAVLRFYGYWNDTLNPDGFIHDLEIYYYLTDNTIEVKETYPSTMLLLRRTKIPKFFTGVEPIGSEDPLTVLNVIGDEAAQSYLLLDALDIGRRGKDYYKDNDFCIGAQINVFGREIVITDMDSFSKEFYRKKYGLEDFTPLSKPKRPEQMSQEVNKFIPPYNGFGSYEDSLGNCFTVMPKPPRPDFIKFIKYDREGFDSRVLRFGATMVTDMAENMNRQFIIRVYLMDDTISIYELAKRNSGFARCPFQKKMLLLLPDQDIYSSEKPKHYRPNDFYIGARLNLGGFQFDIVSADVYTLRYMELHCNEFSKANVGSIMTKIREALRPIYKTFLKEYTPFLKESADTIILDYNKFREAIYNCLDEKITEHEIMTVSRHYSSHEKKEFLTKEYVRGLMHTELNRALWNEMDRLAEDLLHWDTDGSGYLSRHTIYTVLRGARIPVDVELLNSMMDHLRKRDDGKLDCKDLLEFMDVKINPLPPAPPMNIKTVLWWASEKEPDCGTGIDWNVLLKDLNLQDEEEK